MSLSVIFDWIYSNCKLLFMKGMQPIMVFGMEDAQADAISVRLLNLDCIPSGLSMLEGRLR